MKVFRQGDVILIECLKRPSAAATVVVDRGRTILAYGEVTGHAHEVVTAGEVALDDVVPTQQLFQEADGSRLLVCRVPCMLTHQEHSVIALDATTYEVRKQTEWSRDQARQVAD